MSDVTRQRFIRYYVSATVLAAALAVSFALQLDHSFDTSTEGLIRALVFSVLALLTTAIESTSAAGVHGSVAFVSHLAAIVVMGPVGGALVAASSMTAAPIGQRFVPSRRALPFPSR